MREQYAGELILSLEASKSMLHGRFRSGMAARSAHGVVAVPVPTRLSTDAKPCHIATEGQHGDWNVVHPGKDDDNEDGCAWIKFLAPNLVLVGPAFRGVAAGKTSAAENGGGVLVGVQMDYKERINDDSKGFVSKEYAQLEGMGRPDLFASMWADVHGRFCRVEGCEGVDGQGDSDTGKAPIWDEDFLRQLSAQLE